MAEQHIQSKLVSLLKQEKIQLWNSPFTTDNNEANRQQMQELADRYSRVIGFPLLDVENALEDIRSQAVRKGQGNKTYRETSVATLELMVPKDAATDGKRKQHLETKLDITTEDLMKIITQIFNVKYMKLILNGRTLSLDKRLDEQNVNNNSKIMVVKLSEPQQKKEMVEVENKKRLQNESVQRTLKGFEILCERDGSEDPTTTPFLEIADQKGNPIHIPTKEKKALILAMGFHEKGRALMKRKEYAEALCHLLKADEQFSKCNNLLLTTVDNYAVLQLDIVWCHRVFEALDCLQDCNERLQKAENCFLRCYGQEQQRLQQIKRNTGGEDVLFLRLYLLQSLLFYLKGNEGQAAEKLAKGEDLYSCLTIDPEKLKKLMDMGFSEQESRLGLRACRGNVEDAALHITHRNKEREDVRQMEREKRRRRLDGINTLVGLGYSKKSASKALHDTNGDVDEAYRVLLRKTDRPTKVDQMAYLGFQREAVEAALRLTGDDVVKATEMLLDNQGLVPPDMLSPSTSSSSSEEPSTSDSTASGSSGSLDADLVNEVLEDIPRHEEDYLDVTLEEECELIAQIKSYLEKKSAPTS